MVSVRVIGIQGEDSGSNQCHIKDVKMDISLDCLVYYIKLNRSRGMPFIIIFKITNYPSALLEGILCNFPLIYIYVHCLIL